ncbi:MAG TPA: biliverdin-producing heme oxygenase [Acidimicrobiales bacterium]|nr:biliverdin-producing heme oxygenase [Acidimicrobiales bacterium]
MTTETAERFSATVRSETAGDHRGAERSAFMEALMGGTLPLAGYVDMLAQHWYAYERLEAQGERLSSDPVAGAFVDTALLRLPALTTDLIELAGADWQAAYPASTATTEYTAAIDRASAWSGGFVAHHYTRYLGDLSGGQHIGRVAARTYDLAPGRGGNFAVFAIDDPAAYREAYRVRLDEAAWDADEQRRMIDEVHEAYRHNRAVFADLDRHGA